MDTRRAKFIYKRITGYVDSEGFVLWGNSGFDYRVAEPELKEKILKAAKKAGFNLPT